MKKSPYSLVLSSIVTSVFSLLLFQSTTQAIQALEVVVDDEGSTYFYNDQVLGEESKESKERPKREERKKSEPAQKRAAPIKVVPANQDRQLRVKEVESSTELSVEAAQKRDQIKEEKKEQRPVFEKQDVISTERLQLELPAELKTSETQELRSVRVFDERRGRQGEKIELKNEVGEDGKATLELESRSVKAHSRGAEFVIDPTTRNIILTTPSGKQHTLTHLPDQALTRMVEAGVVSSDSAQVEDEVLQIETKEDGRVVYSAQVKKQKRLLGLLKRHVETKVEVDDETGEVETTELPAPTLLGKVANFLSW
jgi:hypothetical protein